MKQYKTLDMNDGRGGEHIQTGRAVPPPANEYNLFHACFPKIKKLIRNF